MSIFPAVIEMLLTENSFKPITGDVLLIGRQTIEGSTQTDKEFFGQFPGIRFHALDVSDYEGADVIWDLNEPVTEASGLCNTADFIFDGSCLDNIWDPATTLKSLSRVLRAGGRMMLMEHGTAIQGALTVFSPEWFFDFFAINNYADCQIKLCYFPYGMCGQWDVLPWLPFNEAGVPVNATAAAVKGDFVSVIIAEKGQNSTDDYLPLQAQYRLLHGTDNSAYTDAHKRFMLSKRHT